MEGKTVKTDIKHEDKEGIKRIPIWITTATPITNNIEYNEQIQILQRINYLNLKRVFNIVTNSVRSTTNYETGILNEHQDTSNPYISHTYISTIYLKSVH